jgi:Xaa-Pro aminopeptidase
MHDHLHDRRRRIAPMLGLRDEILLVYAGRPIPLPEDSDQFYPFFAHSDYYYLTGLNCPGGVLAYDPQDDRWESFVPHISESERIWEGRPPWPGRPAAELDTWFATRQGRTLICLGRPPASIAFDPALARIVQARLHHARRPKDADELRLLRQAVSATAAGFAKAHEILRPGITEREIQIELESEFFRHGAEMTGYETIVGTGPHSAILHFPPGPRETRPGDLVLIDAGASCSRYTADVTRTYAVGKPTPFQRELHQVVREAQRRAIARCLPGVEWKDIHLAAAIDLVAGLVEMDLMRGAPESLVEQEAHELFYPHGLGHMVGLGVRDASGLAPGRIKDPRPSLRSLRMDLPLEPGYVVTVEPGLYFIRPLLENPERRARYRDCVNWDLIDLHLDSGGIRIEDNLLITETGPEVLTEGIPQSL